MLKILVTNCDNAPDGGAAQMWKMLELYELSDKRHSLTNDPDHADYILICDSEWKDHAYKVRKNLFVRKYANKCFILSNDDNPYYYARGILASAEKSKNLLNRFRSTSYTAYYDPYHNPFILHHKHRLGSEKKEYLLSFVGRNSHPVREKIFKLKFLREDIFIKDTSESFQLWSQNIDINQQEFYFNIIMRSKFALCPRGYGVNSIRLYEAMKLGIAPIIISDDFIFPKGPQWNKFAIIIKEQDIENLESIVAGYEDRYLEMGNLARETFEKFFSDKVYFNYIIENVVDIAKTQKIPEALIHIFNDLFISIKKCINLGVRVKNKIARIF